MRLLLGFSWILFLTPSMPCQAEYRAFVLKIQAADGTIAQEVISTLYPDQYQGYYPILPGHTIFYSETWKCPGRTGDFQPICPNPRAAPIPLAPEI